MKGATRIFPHNDAAVVDISIHAPVKGATFRWDDGSWVLNYFNPRTREGCDEDVDYGREKAMHISIHAPVKGATHLIGRVLDALHNFNPRTREGCDEKQDLEKARWYLISIHAPVKGATLDADYQRPGRNISIHAPVKGATTLIFAESPRVMYFNPRTREGCDSLQIGSVTICAPINHIAN